MHLHAGAQLALYTKSGSDYDAALQANAAAFVAAVMQAVAHYIPVIRGKLYWLKQKGSHKAQPDRPGGVALSTVIS